MNSLVDIHPWKIIESSWNPEHQMSMESLFAIGNGKMGQRAMFEESYSAETLQGSYIAGVYYPDKTRVGWWKNGYPEYFAKVLNAPFFIGIDVVVDGQKLDLAQCSVQSFYRELDMENGLLKRRVEVQMNSGLLKIESERFFSMSIDEIVAINYAITPLNCSPNISISPFINGDVYNSDSNYDEQFWEVLSAENNNDVDVLVAQTKKTNYEVAFAQFIEMDGKAEHFSKDKLVGRTYEIEGKVGERLSLNKFVAVCSTLNHAKTDLDKTAAAIVKQAAQTSYARLKKDHADSWAEIWKNSDIVITGDDAAQQAIRFNIFHLNQTYTGRDGRLNIGPKGFTGEKYGGSTYWDTEAYCLPFFLNTAPYQVSEQLLNYRYNQLDKAIENAEKLGFTGGAALYPMVTMTGEECHNEWEITFEEIHRNGAIAFAIFNYTRHSGDKSYLESKGIEVLIGISRFWAQRVNWSERKKKYVMLGVTGPNEYENNINNNFYTNYIAKWTLSYTIDCIAALSAKDKKAAFEKTNFIEDDITFWKDVIKHMYFPYDDELDIYLQQDNFLDKDIISANQLPDSMRPINQHWSWDRILRSCYIKQADTLQTFYFFESDFSIEELNRHFEFYEDITVHESSLSPCVHAVLASSLNKSEKAYEMYMRTARLDLDDYNREVDEGLHITSMAGTWMAIVEGFGGLRIKDDQIHLNPQLPKSWTAYQFKIRFRDRLLQVNVADGETEVLRLDGPELSIVLNKSEQTV